LSNHHRSEFCLLHFPIGLALLASVRVAIAAAQIARGAAMRTGITMMTLLTCCGAAYAQSPPVALPPVEGLRAPIAFRDITPPAQPHAEPDHPLHQAEHHDGKPQTLFFNAEYLLMRPRRGALDFAIRDANRDLIPSGRIESINYELRSGIRAGVATRLADTAWFGDFNYTYLRSGADRDVTAPAGGTLYATLTRPGLNDEANFAAATASLEYNVFNATIGRPFTLDKHTVLHLYGGLRWASISNRFEVRYDGQDANQAVVKADTSFDGFGPLVGGILLVNVHEGFHLYSRCTASLVTGQFRNPLRETNNGGLTQYADLDYSTRRVIPAASLAVGGGWTRDAITIRAGYEITNWFGFVDTPRLSGELSEGRFTTRRSDLSLEGLFVQLGVAY
jgi:hypothetical protein